MDQSSAQNPVSQVLSQILAAHGITHYGFTSLGKPLSLSFYKDWLENGFAGEMNYLKEHLPWKEDEYSLLPTAHSAIVVGVPYFHHPEPLDKPLFTSLKIAKYAQGKDYHFFLKEQLEHLVSEIQKFYPNADFVTATDSSPVLERDLAYRAGLGWFGKNTCLIDQKKGSFFLIGEILTSLELTPVRAVHADRCGTCNRCVEACPTQALKPNKVLDANRCISYLTIESKQLPPTELRAQMGDWFFGCDICQTVCPWNEKAFDSVAEASRTVPSRANLLKDLTYILTSSKKELERAVRGLPLARARGSGLKRNAILVAASLHLHELVPLIAQHQSDLKLGELATWALSAIDSGR